MSDTGRKWYIVTTGSGSKVKLIVNADCMLTVQTSCCMAGAGDTVKVMTWADAIELLGAILPPRIMLDNTVRNGLSIHRGDAQIFVSVL